MNFCPITKTNNKTLNTKNPWTLNVTAPTKSIKFPPKNFTRKGDSFSRPTTTENTTTTREREHAEETPTPKRRRRRRRRGGGFFVGRRRKRRRKNERVASGPDEDDDDGRRTDDDGDEEDLVGFDDRFVVFIQSPRERGGGVECAWSSSASSPSSSFGTRRIVRRREADKTKRDEPRKVGATAKTTGCEL